MWFHISCYGSAGYIQNSNNVTSPSYTSVLFEYTVTFPANALSQIIHISTRISQQSIPTLTVIATLKSCTSQQANRASESDTRESQREIPCKQESLQKTHFFSLCTCSCLTACPYKSYSNTIALDYRWLCHCMHAAVFARAVYIAAAEIDQRGRVCLKLCALVARPLMPDKADIVYHFDIYKTL